MTNRTSRPYDPATSAGFQGPASASSAVCQKPPPQREGSHRRSLSALGFEAGKMLRADLAAARAAWEAEGTSDGVIPACCGHPTPRGGGSTSAPLWHTYTLWVVASGASVKVTQDLARHSTPTRATATQNPSPLVFSELRRSERTDAKKNGTGGIRTLGTGFNQYNGLAIRPVLGSQAGQKLLLRPLSRDCREDSTKLFGLDVSIDSFSLSHFVTSGTDSQRTSGPSPRRVRLLPSDPRLTRQPLLAGRSCRNLIASRLSHRPEPVAWRSEYDPPKGSSTPPT